MFRPRKQWSDNNQKTEVIDIIDSINCNVRGLSPVRGRVERRADISTRSGSGESMSLRWMLRTCI